MGACTTKQDSVSAAGRAGPSSVPKQLSGLYLNREKRCLHQIRGSSIRTFEFPAKSMKLRADSAIGYLGERIIAMAGGTSSAGTLTNDVLILDAITKQMKNLTPLPIGVKGGTMLKYSNAVYLVGAVDEEDKPCPLLKYSMATFEWETIEVDGVIEYSKLLNGGYFLIENRLYIVAGQRINSVGRAVSSKKIYYIDLDQENLQMAEESARFPMKATDLSCMSFKREAITIGCESQLAFRIRFGEEVEITQIGSLPFTKKDNFPGIFDAENRIVVFSFPRMAILMVNEWEEYNAAVHYKASRSSLMICSGNNSRREAVKSQEKKMLKKRLRGRSNSSEREEPKAEGEETTKRGEETKREEIVETKKGEEVIETKKGEEIVEFSDEKAENKVEASNLEVSEVIDQSNEDIIPVKVEVLAHEESKQHSSSSSDEKEDKEAHQLQESVQISAPAPIEEQVAEIEVPEVDIVEEKPHEIVQDKEEEKPYEIVENKDEKTHEVDEVKDEEIVPESIKSSQITSKKSKEKSLGSSSSSEDLNVPKAITAMISLSKPKLTGKGATSSSGSYKHQKGKYSKKSKLVLKSGNLGEELGEKPAPKSKESSKKIEIRRAGSSDHSSKNSVSSESDKEGSSAGSESSDEISSSESNQSRIISNSF